MVRMSGFQEVGREGVAEGVGRDVLGNLGGDRNAPHFFLNDRLMKVVGTSLTGGGIDVGAGRGEYPLPGPLPGRGGVFSTEIPSRSRPPRWSSPGFGPARSWA